MRCLFLGPKNGAIVGLTAAFILAFLSCAGAAEFGLGISANSNDQSIYVPVQITENFRTEFSVGYDSEEIESADTKVEFEAFEIGVGLYMCNEVYERTQLYYGCRFLYIQQDRELVDGSVHRYLDSEGYGIAPTLGFEYYLTDHISLGGEAAFRYVKIDGEGDTTGPISASEDETIKNTDTRAVIRYYF